MAFLLCGCGACHLADLVQPGWQRQLADALKRQ